MQPLIVDSRETNSGIPRMLEHAGVTIEMMELEAGDYQIGAMLLERKTATDLYASIMDGRLFPQAEAMCLRSERPILLIEGDIRMVAAQMHPDALMGALSALSVFWQMQVITLPDKESTVQLLRVMHRHTTEGLGYEVPMRPSKPKSAQPDAGWSLFVLEGLPGVGPKMARNLLAHFGSVASVAMASEADLRKCAGVGPKTATGIRKVLDHRPAAARSTSGPMGA